VAEHARIDASVSGDICMAHASGYQFDEKLVLLWLASEHVLPLPIMLIVSNNAFARYGILRHGGIILVLQVICKGFRYEHASIVGGRYDCSELTLCTYESGCRRCVTHLCSSIPISK